MTRKTITVLTILVLCSAVPIDAQGCDTELDEFRIELENFVADLYKASDLAKQLDYPTAADLEGAVAEFDVELEGITEEQLYDLCLLFDRSPSLIEAPNALAEAMRLVGNGQEWHPCLGPAAQTTLLAYVLYLELAAGVVETTCSVLGCIDVSGLGCANVCAGAGIAKIIEVIAELVYTLQDHACLQEHFDLLVDVKDDLSGIDSVDSYVDAMKTEVTSNLDAQVSTRASQTSVDSVAVQLADVDATLGTPRTATITGDIVAINAGLADQKADREAYQDLKLSLTIEFELAHGTWGQFASFRLPSAFGGQLEEVRETVATAITMHINAGQSINNAMHYFNLADGYFNGGVEYDLAFENYRLAYQQAVMLSADE